jgi:hypothetical protein
MGKCRRNDEPHHSDGGANHDFIPHHSPLTGIKMLTGLTLNEPHHSDDGANHDYIPCQSPLTGIKMLAGLTEFYDPAMVTTTETTPPRCWWG